ncbi:MAG: hypothetical protein PF569_02670 [Candidatus Woesearchaeota archaeon]|jgi:hypothetical protein|nr:hypothetical protein [Candidatus Woesearchaeota archaeon]
MKEEMIEKNKIDFLAVVYVALFTNFFLFVSSYWFSYTSFYLGIILISIILVGVFFMKKSLLKYLLPFNLVFYFYFLFLNFNYIFIFGISIILGLLGLHLLSPKIEIPSFVYSLILLLILGHVIWFDILPLGYQDEFTLDIGSLKDDSISSEVYIIDSNDILSPPQSYGDETWRSFEEDGEIYFGFNTPVNLENKTIEVKMKYDATGPVYINGELFYDPAWGSSVIYGESKEEFIYGSKMFNLEYANISEYSENFDTIDDYLEFNFPNGVLMKDFTGNYLELENRMNLKYLDSINSVDFYDNWSSSNMTSFSYYRGPIKFYGVFDESIDLNLLKQDLNLYNGSDSVKITIRDFENNLIATRIIEDNDGVVNRTTQESSWKEFSIEIPLENSGIYNIEFEHTNYSEDPDFLIGNLSFNSNKVMYDGEFLLWSKGVVYNNDLDNLVRVRYWWSGFNQFIIFDDFSFFELDEDMKGSWVELDAYNKTSFDFEKGKLIVDPEFNLAVFPNTDIDTDLVEQIQITKSRELSNENIKFVNVDGLKISSIKGTKIYNINVEIS